MSLMSNVVFERTLSGLIDEAISDAVFLPYVDARERVRFHDLSSAAHRFGGAAA
jgi:hypothetical protein